MSDEAAKKTLKDLRVTDLKAQLEKRGLATSGVKAVLQERLAKYIEEETGAHVDEFDFDKSSNEATAAVVPQEEDAIHLMIEDEENLFEEEERRPSPPRPENAPVLQPFTSSDTISLSSRNKAPSENSSMLVNPDEEVLREGSPSDDEGTKRGRNLWVSGLASSYRATDLKKVFSAHGNVIGAKVVTNTKTPGARCYGYVTMGSLEEASECIKHLNKTELHNKVISVERAQSGENGPPKREEEPPKNEEEERLPSSEPKGDVDEENHTDMKTQQQSPPNGGRSRSPFRGGRRMRYHHHNPRFRRLAPGDARNKIRDVSPRREDRSFRPGVLTVSQIREQRDKEVDDNRRWRDRAREAEDARRLRDREIRRLEDAEYRREMERRRRSEEERFERERLELRREREKIEREKAELLKYERERQRFERERLQREKEELERLRWEQSRLDDSRRAVKRPGLPLSNDHNPPMRGNYEGGNRMKRAPPSIPNEHQARGHEGGYYEDRKRDYHNNSGNSQMSMQRYPNAYNDNSSNRGYDRPRYESRGGFSGGRRDNYRGERQSNESSNRNYSSPWDSSSTPGSSKSNYMMGSGNDWNSRAQNSSQPAIPRPPILSGISMGVNSSSFGGSGNMGGSSNGFNNGYSGASHSNQSRYDNYKGNLGPKRY